MNWIPPPFPLRLNLSMATSLLNRPSTGMLEGKLFRICNSENLQSNFSFLSKKNPCFHMMFKECIFYREASLTRS